MKERASSCVRAPSAATVSSACTSGEASRRVAVRAERKPARLAERAQPVEDGVGARRAVLPVCRARRREVLPRAPVGSLRHGAALLVAGRAHAGTGRADYRRRWS